MASGQSGKEFEDSVVRSVIAGMPWETVTFMVSNSAIEAFRSSLQSACEGVSEDGEWYKFAGGRTVRVLEMRVGDEANLELGYEVDDE